MLWIQIAAAAVGGILVMAANLLSGRQQTLHDARKSRTEVLRAERSEKLLLITEFLANARILEGWAVSLQNNKPHERPDENWNKFWNSHAVLDLVLEPGSRDAVRKFADRLRRATLGENEPEPVWVYLELNRNEMLDMLRDELKVSLKACRLNTQESERPHVLISRPLATNLNSQKLPSAPPGQIGGTSAQDLLGSVESC